jgi:hypothetical protein
LGGGTDAQLDEPLPWHLDSLEQESRKLYCAAAYGLRLHHLPTDGIIRIGSKAIAGLFRRISTLHSSRNEIPYNILPESGAGFDKDTLDFIAGPHGEGFSCATFVVHAFRSIEHPILNTDGWPCGRPGDRERQQELIQMLRKEGYTDWADQVERNELGCPRIAPEEVAGACLEDGLPAAFQQCEPNGRLLLAVLDWQTARYPRTS